MQHIAAVDLGSNSFHMVVARVDDEGRLRVVDRLKDRVRIGGGIDANGALTAECQERALRCLERFGDRLREFPRGSVRVVGTQTLRKATNAHTFLIRAKRALGHPIDIISGQEEARLIHLGVRGEFSDRVPRLLVDIGGGSTELILSDGTPRVLESLVLGCVTWTRLHFAETPWTEATFDRATRAAQVELARVQERFPRGAWVECVGSSGTIRALGRVTHDWGFGPVTVDGLKAIQRALADGQDVPLSSSRVEVLPGGLAIARAVMETFQVDELIPAQSALREGALADLLGRLNDRDVRGDTVRRLSERMGVDGVQAERVRETAMRLFEAARDPWSLLPRHRDLLAWAATLHEVGQVISGSGYHRHGAYLVEHSELAGFSLQDRRLLAAMIRVHRGGFSADRMAEVAPGVSQRVVRLAVLLRIARDLHRSRTETAIMPEFWVHKNTLHLVFQPGELAALPLLRDDLQEEVALLTHAGHPLVVSERSD